MNPGDIFEGKGWLLYRGQRVVAVDYHLTIPHQSHFLINPTGKLYFEYEDHLAGFVLVTPAEEDKIQIGESYLLEMANMHRRQIKIDRRYKKIVHNKEARVSYWVTLATNEA